LEDFLGTLIADVLSSKPLVQDEDHLAAEVQHY